MSEKKKIIDVVKLKQLLEEGLYTDQIADRMGCAAISIGQRIRKLGLTPNYRRLPKGAAPAPVRGTRPLSHPSPTRGEGFTGHARRSLTLPKPYPTGGDCLGGSDVTPGQVIPVTLQLTVDIHLRVSTEGVHVA